MLDIQTTVNGEEWEEVSGLIEAYKELREKEALSDTFFALEATCHIHDKRWSKAEASVREGFFLNIYNPELYFMLGNIKESRENFAQALFAMRMPAFMPNKRTGSFWRPIWRTLDALTQSFSVKRQLLLSPTKI